MGIKHTDRNLYREMHQESYDSIPSDREMDSRRLTLRDAEFDNRMVAALGGVDLSTQAGKDAYWQHSLAIGCQLDTECL